jgi:hypothetical protein
MYSPDQRRPKSAPATPEKTAPKVKKPITPGPRFGSLQLLQQNKIHEASAYQLGLCSEHESRMCRIAPFPILFSWNRGLKPSWKNDVPITLSDKVSNLIIVYRVDVDIAKSKESLVQQVQVLYDGEQLYEKIQIPSDPKYVKQSRYAYRYPDQRLVIEINLDTIRGTSKQMVIHFSNPQVIKEVIILRHNVRFLEIAGIVPVKITSRESLQAKLQTIQDDQKKNRDSPGMRSPPRALMHINNHQKANTPKAQKSNAPEIDTRTPNGKENRPHVTSALVGQILEGLKRRKILNTPDAKNTSRNVCTQSYHYSN